MPPLKHLNTLDYLVVAVYLLIVIGTGIYVSRFNKKTSDYFKGGGHVPWGLSMVSLFVSGFSAFMFVGAAGVTYNNGGGAIILFSLALPAYLIGYYIYGPALAAHPHRHTAAIRAAPFLSQHHLFFHSPVSRS